MYLSVYIVVVIVFLILCGILYGRTKTSVLFDKKGFLREMLVILTAITGIYWALSLLEFLANLLVGLWN